MSATTVRAGSSERRSAPAPCGADGIGRQYEALVRRIRTSLNAEAGQPCAIGVTSCTRGEGVTTVAANLAVHGPRVFERPVLLIEANFERPSLSDVFGVPHRPGLADALSSRVGLDGCAHHSPVRGLSVMPAGTVGADPRIPACIATRLFESLRNRYGFIIVDLPPAAEPDVGLVLSDFLEGLVLVVEAERLRLQVVERAKELFARCKANMLGVVLNKRRMHIPDWLYHRL